jgi:hypothetical protein
MTMRDYKSIELTPPGSFGGKLDREKLDEMLNEHGPEGWQIANPFHKSGGSLGGQTTGVIAVFVLTVSLIIYGMDYAVRVVLGLVTSLFTG